jgi:tRNA-2-methylthio-N6-dimethylallyladenosine synthase
MAHTYNIWTIGCQMNEADTRHLSSQLEAMGYNSQTEAESADLVVLNTCVVRQQAEDKAINRLHVLKRAKEERPGMTIALMGCMVGMREAPALKKKFPFVDVFMPPSETAPLIDYLSERGLYNADRSFDTREKALREAIQDEEFALPSALRGQSVTANVPVVLGCSHACTFCIIPYRRGAERSKRPEDVLREVRTLADQGVREVMLLGQIIDRYGMDFEDGTDLAGLLTRVAAIPELQRVRFLTSHPNWMTDRLIKTVADTEKICPQIEIPVQAGHDVVLERMRRGYTVDDYRRVVDRIRTHIPDAAIHTDIIVGFCGETDEQFMGTYRLAEEMQWEKVHIAKYSVRPKTIATRTMEDDVPADEKERRRRMLDDLQTSILEKKNAAYLGRLEEVLVENKHKGKWRGRTRHNKLVFFEDTRDCTGQLVPVQITSTAPYSMVGEVCVETPCLVC